MRFPGPWNNRSRFGMRSGLVLALLLMAALYACSKRAIIVPLITPEPTHVWHVGKFVWYDLFTHDLESASRFYGEIFGWEFIPTASGSSRVRTIEQDGTPIGNAIKIDPQKQKEAHPAWLSYMSVDDVDASAKWVQQHRGAIKMPPKDLPERGRVVVVEDPEGAVFALLTASGGDPRDEDPYVNSWLGSELWARDPAEALDFYRPLAGYELKSVNIENGPPYGLLIMKGEVRGGIVRIPWEGIEPNWLPYVVVEDAEATTQRALELGGAVLMAPDDEIRSGSVGILADPSGAVFAVQQF